MTANSLKHQASLVAWREKVCACRSSGMSVSAWCREQGVTTTTYYKWERLILNERQMPGSSERPPEPVFTELPCASPSALRVVSKDVVATVRMGAASLDIYPGANAEILNALFEAMRHAE